MIRIFFILLFFVTGTFAQEFPSSSPFHSSAAIEEFANALYCDGDYFRAALEYEKLIETAPDDTPLFYAALSYKKAGSYEKAIPYFHGIDNTAFSQAAGIHLLQSYFLTEEYDMLAGGKIPDALDTLSTGLLRLRLSYAAALLTGKAGETEIPSQSLFTGTVYDSISYYRSQYLNPDFRSPTAAAILSAIIPGTGKIYTGSYSDGITSLLVTGLLAFLSYDNFQEEHTFRGWLFGGLTAFFYAGNIYGSAVSAMLYNREFEAMRERNLRRYVEKENYFSTAGEESLCE